MPVAALTTALYAVHSSFSVAAGSSASFVMPATSFAASSGWSNCSAGMSSTMRPYIEMKRRYES